MDPIVIVSQARTPLGGFMGSLASLKAYELGAYALRAAVERSTVSATDVDEVIMGCVLSAGQGQAPARQATLTAGFPNTLGATTINKVCGSGMKSIMVAHDILIAGSRRCMLAGGMESMSNAPYILEKARNGYRMGHGQIKDHMFLDGLEDAYDRGKLMGTFAEATAEKYGFTRAQQDAFAIQSLTRAKKAIELGLFQEEIVPVPVLQGKTEVMITQDEQPGNAKIDKIPQLKPAFKDPGTVTAANSSSISDGAAALMLMRLSEAQRRGLTPLAKIVGHTSYAHEPQWFTTAPVTAMERLMQEIHWTRDQVDLFEINEAFAVVTLAAIHDLKLDPEKVNIHGGACALGHPLGASGTRIVCTLLSALKHHNLNRGIASLCVGGGEATAIAIDRII